MPDRRSKVATPISIAISRGPGVSTPFFPKIPNLNAIALAVSDELSDHLTHTLETRKMKPFALTTGWEEGGVCIPMMSITQSDLMPISAERSDAGLSQCERVIGMSQ
jgi:hypothetical protein